MTRRIVRTAVVLGVFLGAYVFAAIFILVSYLPSFFGILIPLVTLLTPILMFWPSRFDEDLAARWPRRLGHRMAAVLGGTVVAGLVSFLIVLAVPSYTAWSDNQHRASLRRRGMAEAEIELQVAAHRQSPQHHLIDGVFSTGAPGTVAALVTTVAGAVMFRRRRTP